MSKTHIVSHLDEGTRLDKLLKKLNDSFSREQVQTWIRENHVTVNNKHQKANYKCKINDVIEWHFQPEKEVSVEIKPERIPLHILYEDSYLLVINKPKGMLVHPTQTERTNTLVNALKYYCSKLSNVSGEERPGIVHRLDKDTSGVLVVAKDNETHEHLKNQFKSHSVTRVYEAICFGAISHSKGVIKAPIGRNPKNRLQMAVTSNGKYAETHFKVLERFSQYTYVECQLITGRTHQIRVHLKYMNHPIVGDEVYCKKKTNFIKGQALFSKQISFIHPITKESMTFTVDQPEDFKNLLQKLKNIS